MATTRPTRTPVEEAPRSAPANAPITTLAEAIALFPDPGPVAQKILWLGSFRTVEVRVLKSGEEQRVLGERARAGETEKERDQQESVSRFGRALVSVDGKVLHFSDNPYEDLQQRIAYAMEWHDPLIDQIGIAFYRAMERVITQQPEALRIAEDFPTHGLG